jgi:hypothetical protein
VLFIACLSQSGLLALAGATLAFLYAVGWETFYVTPALAALLYAADVPSPFFPREYVLWSIFLPVAAEFSVDRALHPAPPALPRIFLSVATFGVMAQIVDGWAAIFLLIALLPSRFWDRLGRGRWRAEQARWMAWFDGECGVCRILARLVAIFAILPDVPFRPAQADPAVLAVMERENSWVLQAPDGSLRLRFEALADLIGLSPWLAWLAPGLRLPGLRELGNAAYTCFARRRAFWARFFPAIRPRRILYGGARWLQFVLVLLVFWSLYGAYRRIQPEVQKRVFEILDEYSRSRLKS